MLLSLAHLLSSGSLIQNFYPSIWYSVSQGEHVMWGMVGLQAMKGKVHVCMLTLVFWLYQVSSLDEELSQAKQLIRQLQAEKQT